MNQREDIQEGINLNTHNFIIGPVDTDSISACKADGSPFSLEELDVLMMELRSISPEFMEWESDGYYECCIALRAKNYVLWDGKKKHIKGSAFKTSSKEPILGKMMQEIVDSLIFNDINYDLLGSIYHKYIKEAMNVTDITQWCSKKSISQPILACEGWDLKTKEQLKEEGIRTNEIQIWEAIKDLEDKQDGNKVYTYPAILSYSKIETQQKNGKVKVKEDIKTGLKLRDNWNNDHDKYKLVERVYSTLCIFEKLFDMSRFTDYTLKKNREYLDTL